MGTGDWGPLGRCFWEPQTHRFLWNPRLANHLPLAREYQPPTSWRQRPYLKQISEKDFYSPHGLLLFTLIFYKSIEPGPHVVFLRSITSSGGVCCKVWLIFTSRNQKKKNHMWKWILKMLSQDGKNIKLSSFAFHLFSLLSIKLFVK